VLLFILAPRSKSSSWRRRYDEKQEDGGGGSFNLVSTCKKLKLALSHQFSVFDDDDD
jgi:hypothetical protein